MAVLSLMLNNISDALKASKIHLNPSMPMRQNLYIKGKTKFYRYSIFYDFKESRYCVIHSPNVKDDKHKNQNHVNRFDFPSEVVDFVNELKVNGV